jgi:hypothetical protein
MRGLIIVPHSRSERLTGLTRATSRDTTTSRSSSGVSLPVPVGSIRWLAWGLGVCKSATLP